jgi:hypothetical protein
MGSTEDRMNDGLRDGQSAPPRIWQEADGGDDLDWLAFRYAANEMSDAEIESFERRLQEDTAACEAVAQAVNLSHALAVVTRDAEPKRAPRRGLSAWRFGAVAAGIAAAVSLYALYQYQPRDLKMLARVARVWAKHMSQEPFGASDSGLIAGVDDAGQAAEDDDWTVPSWMMEAVGGISDGQKLEDI